MIRNQYTGPANPLERFMEKVVEVSESGCWIWVGSQAKSGYGTFNSGNNKTVSAHRWAYLQFNGKIDEGLLVCHGCDVRQCVNPDHLFLGSHKENMRDASRKNRLRGGNNMIGEDQHLSKLSEESVRYIRQNYTRGDGRKLADKFGVSINAILCVVKNKTWKHVK